MFLLQPVPSVALSAPFVTDAEVYMYFEDHCGIVDSPGTVVRFYHPQIAGIRIDGWPAVADARHHNCLECYVPEGRHKVIVDVRESPAVLSMREHVNGDRFYDQVCASADELERCAALAQPGDTLVIQNGVYENFEAMLTCSGREGRPIVIKPETPGGVEFCLQSRVTLKGDYLVLREFRFDHCETTRARAVAIEGSHNRMTQCQFFYCGNPVLSWSSIVSIEMEAHYNRVDHCYWTGSYSQSLVQRNDQRRPGTHGVGNRYDHNIFRDIIRRI